MTDSTQATPDQEAPPDIPVAEVKALMSTMGKALRAFVMYEPNNPVFQRFQKDLRTSIEHLWEEGYALELIVTEDGFRYAGHTFVLGEGRDNLAFAFYKDGIRSLTFLPGFEEEVGPFLDAVNRAIRRESDADDLITVLWEEDFAALQYGYVDLLMEGVTIPDEPREEPKELEAGVVGELAPAGEEPEAGETRAGATGALTAQAISAADFDETLYFLDQGEMARLQTEVELEMERDVRAAVLNALFDRLEEPEFRERQAEILGILDQLLPLLLSSGDLKEAARVLDELGAVVGGERPVLGPELRERVEKVFDRLSEPEVLEQFVQALEDGAVDPGADEVNLFFARLRAEAMPILIRFAEMSETAGVAERLESAIDGLAERYPERVNELLASDEPLLVRGAAKVAGRIGLGQAVDGLKRALEHPDRAVRMAVVDALVAIRLTPALQALTLALDDEDRDVRVAAVNALGAVRFASARDELRRHVQGKRIKGADLTEKMAFFEAYGAIGGSTAVEELDDLLNSKGFLGRRNPTELRACAALGLGKAATKVAKEALEKAREDEDPVVRNAVVRALKEE
ncbi:MAG: HEAT repeat domain-containing protein [Candidatus Longimicrobiales bacterium M2_2A_002]